MSRADDTNNRINKLSRQAIKPGQELQANVQAQNEIAGINSQLQNDLAMEQAQANSRLANNQMLQQAAGVMMSGGGGGGGAPQVSPVRRQAAGMNPQTQKILSQYGINPSSRPGTKTQRVANTSQSSKTSGMGTTNVRTENITNNTSTTRNEIKIVQPQIPIAQPTIPMRQQAGNDTAKFKTWLSGMFAKQQNEAEVQKKEFRRREWSLRRSADKMMSRIQSSSKAFADKMNPSNMGQSVGSQLKSIFFPMIFWLLGKYWNPIMNFLESLEYGFRTVFGLPINQTLKNNAMKKNGLLYKLSEFFGMDDSSGTGGKSFFQRFENIISQGVNQLIEKLKVFWQDRVEAVKTVSPPKFELGNINDPFGILKPILTGFGETMRSGVGYLGDILGALVGGSKGAVRSVRNQITRQGIVDLKKMSAGEGLGQSNFDMFGNLKSDSNSTYQMSRTVGQAATASNGKLNVGAISTGVSQIAKVAEQKGSATISREMMDYLGWGNQVGKMKQAGLLQEVPMREIVVDKDQDDMEFVRDSWGNAGKGVGEVAGTIAGFGTGIYGKIGKAKEAGKLISRGVKAKAVASGFFHSGIDSWIGGKLGYAAGAALGGAFGDKYKTKLVPMDSPEHSVGGQGERVVSVYKISDKGFDYLKGVGGFSSWDNTDTKFTELIKSRAKVMAARNGKTGLKLDNASAFQRLGDAQVRADQYEKTMHDINTGQGAYAGRWDDAVREEQKWIGRFDSARSAVGNFMGTVAYNGVGAGFDMIVGKYRLNIHQAVNRLRQNAPIGSRPKGQCAKYVRLALEAGGFNTSNKPRFAADYVYFLPLRGWNEYRPNQLPLMGDICVTERFANHKHGHIAMFDGIQWISDFRQKTDCVYEDKVANKRHNHYFRFAAATNEALRAFNGGQEMSSMPDAEGNYEDITTWSGGGGGNGNTMGNVPGNYYTGGTYPGGGNAFGGIPYGSSVSVKGESLKGEQMYNFRYLYSELKNKLGLSDPQIAGILGNAWQESRFVTNVRNSKGDGGAAIFQWTYPARKKAFIEKEGVPPERASVEQQADFLLWELQQPQYKKHVLDPLRNCTTPEQAAAVFFQYENGKLGKIADVDGTLVNRQNFAKNSLAIMNGQGGNLFSSAAGYVTSAVQNFAGKAADFIAPAPPSGIETVTPQRTASQKIFDIQKSAYGAKTDDLGSYIQIDKTHKAYLSEDALGNKLTAGDIRGIVEVKDGRTRTLGEEERKKMLGKAISVSADSLITFNTANVPVLQRQGGGAMVFDLGFHSADCYPGIPSTLKRELSGGISLSVILSQNFEIHTILVNNKNLSADLFGKNLRRGVVFNDDRTKVVGSASDSGFAALGHYFFYLPGFLNIATQKTSVWNPLYIAAGFAPKLPKTATEAIHNIQNLLKSANKMGSDYIVKGADGKEYDSKRKINYGQRSDYFYGAGETRRDLIIGKDLKGNDIGVEYKKLLGARNQYDNLLNDRSKEVNSKKMLEYLGISKYEDIEKAYKDDPDSFWNDNGIIRHRRTQIAVGKLDGENFTAFSKEDLESRFLKKDSKALGAIQDRMVANELPSVSSGTYLDESYLNSFGTKIDRGINNSSFKTEAFQKFKNNYHYSGGSILNYESKWNESDAFGIRNLHLNINKATGKVESVEYDQINPATEKIEHKKLSRDEAFKLTSTNGFQSLAEHISSIESQARQSIAGKGNFSDELMAAGRHTRLVYGYANNAEFQDRLQNLQDSFETSPDNFTIFEGKVIDNKTGLEIGTIDNEGKLVAHDVMKVAEQAAREKEADVEGTLRQRFGAFQRNGEWFVRINKTNLKLDPAAIKKLKVNPNLSLKDLLQKTTRNISRTQTEEVYVTENGITPTYLDINSLETGEDLSYISDANSAWKKIGNRDGYSITSWAQSENDRLRKSLSSEQIAKIEDDLNERYAAETAYNTELLAKAVQEKEGHTYLLTSDLKKEENLSEEEQKKRAIDQIRAAKGRMLKEGDTGIHIQWFREQMLNRGFSDEQIDEALFDYANNGEGGKPGVVKAAATKRSARENRELFIKWVDSGYTSNIDEQLVSFINYHYGSLDHAVQVTNGWAGKDNSDYIRGGSWKNEALKKKEDSDSTFANRVNKTPWNHEAMRRRVYKFAKGQEALTSDLSDYISQYYPGGIGAVRSIMTLDSAKKTTEEEFAKGGSAMSHMLKNSSVKDGKVTFKTKENKLISTTLATLANDSKEAADNQTKVIKDEAARQEESDTKLLTYFQTLTGSTDQIVLGLNQIGPAILTKVANDGNPDNTKNSGQQNSSWTPIKTGANRMQQTGGAPYLAPWGTPTK